MKQPGRRCDYGIVSSHFHSTCPLLLDDVHYNLSLDLVINENVVKYRLFPFNIVYKSIDIKDIKEIYLRKFDPIREFGGWGIRNSLKNNGTGYTLSSTDGLQIVLKNNKKLLIEVSDNDQIKHVINSIKPSLQSF